MMDCQNCDLSRENQEFRRIIARQQKVIERQREMIEIVMVYAGNVYSQAASVLSKGGAPRGTWSLWRGRGEVAREVYNRLNGG